MRTRKQAERENQTDGSLTAISHDSVGKILKRAKTNPRKKDGCSQGWEAVDKMRNSSDAGEMDTEKPDIQMIENSLQQEPSSEALASTEEGSFQPSNPPVGEEMDVQWEDGLASTLLSAENHSDSLVGTVTNEKSYQTSNSPDKHSEAMAKCVTIEFDAIPKSTPKKTIRRASAEEKEIAELVHKAHLLCLLGRGRLIDAACNDPLIQASLLSILPSQLSEISRIKKLNVKALVPVVHWFHNNFHARGTTDSKRSVSSALVHALETREGTSEEVAALLVTLFRALNLTTRFVTILDIAPVKPETTKSESPDEHASRARKSIFNAATLMVSRLDQASTSSAKQFSSDDRTNASKVFSKDTCRSKNNKLLRNSSKCKEPCVANQQKIASNAACDDELTVKKSGDPKRRGDLEYQMQLEMALSATAVGSLDSSSNLGDTGQNSISKNEDSTLSSQGISTAIGSRKVGAPLHWAEVYCPGENLTGKWVHVDAVNAIIDGEEKVEAAAAACKTSLRYVVAFAGSGAKDITRRYCMKWYKIAPQRVDSNWWDAVLAPLKELESCATGGVVHLEDGGGSVRHEKENAINRSALEDMELETRALTEPLPSNQQAYKNHPLYALERWLTKYQILHPKGPVLGFCSGQPVYPRATVQVLHTKNRWLCEGLQLKANELPSKVLKCSRRLNKPQSFEGGDHDEENSKRDVMLYGKWQTEPLILPHAVNGIVPKNERGQVDVWSEKCLPPGTVHLRLRFVALVAKRLEIDYAPAMVGFDFRNGRSFPVFEGIVVCAEFKDIILEAYAEQEERRMMEEKKRNEAQAASRWYQLLSSIITRQKLNNRYGNNTSTQVSAKKTKVYEDASRQSGGDVDCKDNQIRLMESNAGVSLAEMGEEHEHEHVFVLDEEAVDETSWMQTKRCYCGFSIQVEEL